MEIVYINPDKAELNRAVVATVGFFDGVHLGHRYLLEQLKAIAKKKHLPTAVVTFPVHPRKVLSPNFSPNLLNSFEEKLEQLATTGVDYCFVLNFTADLAALSARAFIQQVLHKHLAVDTLLVGYDHRFGKDRADGLEQYVQYGKEVGMEVVEAGPLQVDGADMSSTRIRNLLAKGAVAEVASCLAYPYSLHGVVVEGDKIGRTIDFPTANVQVDEPDKQLPAEGVYLSKVSWDSEVFWGLLYIGYRPSISGAEELRVEVNVLAYSGNLYGKNIRLVPVVQLRGDEKFSNLLELQIQLEKDRRLALERSFLL